jgi:hypothetical protein
MGDTFYRLCSMGLAVEACGVVGIAPAASSARINRPSEVLPLIWSPIGPRRNFFE